MTPPNAAHRTDPSRALPRGCRSWPLQAGIDAHTEQPVKPAASPTEAHRSADNGWLRAAVLGANDGIVSTGSLMVGVAAAHASAHSILVTGVAGLVAGAMSMAAGEYVSVHSQSDTEAADLRRERAELAADPQAEQRELAALYQARGLEAALADQVASQLMAKDALGAHALEELGISPMLAARPLQAALASAGSFAVGALLPLLVALVVPVSAMMVAVTTGSVLGLVVLGMLAARVGGASIWIGAWRVGFWGALAMLVTAGVGTLFEPAP